MKKTLLFFFTLLLCTYAFCQKRGWEVDYGVSLGAYDRSGVARCSEIVDVSRSYDVNTSHYESRPTVLPTFSMEVGYNMADIHLGYFLGAYWNYAWNNLHGGPSLLQEKEHILHIMPELRFYYLYEEKTKLYATMGAGIRYRSFSEIFEGDRISNSNCEISYQVCPFGMMFGDRWAVACEVGYGTAWAIMKLGARYNF
jgi:hypothetical protein